MSAGDFLNFGATGASVVAAFALVKAAWHINTSKVWKEEAAAQKARADRLQEDMTEVKERLSRIEKENRRLVEILTALDPERLAELRHH